MNKILNKAVKYYTNQRGWKANKKIVVFESDDWGSVRMPNRKAYLELSRDNDKIERDVYSKFDTIATKEDLEHLFEVLTKFKDIKGNHPVITANTIVANPNFEKIKKNNFKNYYYEKFDTSIKSTLEGDQVLDLWKKGIDLNIFKPQLHGREHLHALLWLKELRNSNKQLLAAFDHGCFGLPYSPTTSINRKNVMGALDYVGIPGEKEFQRKYIEEGAQIFETFFGYKSRSFIAPKYIWHPDIEVDLKKQGVDIIQGLPIQYMPNIKKDKFSKKLHYIGQKNKLQQKYITRNSFFEPAIYPNLDHVDIALNKIEVAFKYNKPAIIGTHRINFMGGLIEDNRKINLNSFGLLLKQILKKWPTVEFMSSDQLSDLID